MTNIIEKCFLELANVGVRQLFENTNLSCKCSRFPRIRLTPVPVGGTFLDLVRLDHLDGKPLATHTMHGFVDRGKGAFTKLDPEVVERVDSFSGRASSDKSKDIS